MADTFAIFRFEKVKSLAELGRRDRHNNRSTDRGLEHTDPSKPPSLLAGDAGAVAAWHTRVEEAGIDTKKLRKDATLGIEWLASASPAWWETATDEMKAEWRDTTLSHIIEEAGGDDNILSAWLHEDESTPHMQVLSIPVVEKEVKARGRQKKGAPPKEPRRITTLAAKDIVGGHRDVAIEKQTAYASKVASLGLRRGIPRKETGRRNLSPAKWRAMKADETRRAIMATTKAESHQEAASQKDAEATETLEAAKAKAHTITSTAKERAEAFSVGLEAVDRGEIKYRPKTAEKDEAMVVERADKGSILPARGEPWKRFRAAITPFIGTLQGYARRIAGVEAKERKLDDRESSLKKREKQAEHILGQVDGINTAINEMGIADEVIAHITRAKAQKRKGRSQEER